MPILIAGGALIGATYSYSSQVYDNYQSNGGDLGSALTNNIDLASIGEAAVTGAVIGLTVGVAGPAALALAGDALLGVGLVSGSTTVFSAGIVVTEASVALGAAIYGTTTANNPLEGIRYSEKVKQQATLNDYHGFPEQVDAFGVDGNVYQSIGSDGAVYTNVEIEGGYKNAEGVFHYIIDSSGVCHHRMFEPC